MFVYPEYQKILFCADFSESSERTFACACAIANRDKGKIYLLHVIPIIPNKAFIVESMIPRDALDTAHKNNMEALEKEFQEKFISKCKKDVEFETVIREGRECQEIINFALEEKVDLIVLGTHGLAGISHFLLGSVAEKVVRHSPVPVFVVPSAEKSEKGKVS